MKLYVYDHCPYCVRARMPFALKDIDFELAFLPNDDEATPIAMTGRKILPVLEERPGEFLGESLDIVARLDALKGPELFSGDAPRPVLDWLSRFGGLVNGLVIPRTPDPVFPEFRDAPARAYFTAKKERDFGPFETLLARTDALKAQMEAALEALVPHLPDPEGASIADILLFPVLRSLTIVPELAFPAAVDHYLSRMAARSGVPLVPELRAAAPAAD